ncbi:hypothetical protein LCGC14_0667750 [marine sediment metagenome]|uniref:Uncharacterized protein n=1 Tax=marine sediment metagenome TaxID=412755 RepID=A0A0F9TD90_9ZZZZ
MTIENMHIWFDILQDKYNTPYFTAAERDHFINDAALDFVLEFLHEDKDGNKGLEDTPYSNMALKNILLTVPVTAASALLTTAAISTAISAADMIVPVKIRPQTVNTRSAKFTRHQDIDEDLNNTLSDLAASSPRASYVIQDDGIQIYPTTDYAVVVFDMVILVAPTDAVHSASTDLVDLPGFTHRKIVAKALVKTGLVTEDQAISLMDGVTAG